jgi:pyridoxine 5'-phosphate synthase
MVRTKLSVNINKIATIRNARGGNLPDVLEAARRIYTEYGADGITVHPRPDARHITYEDVRGLSELACQLPLNIEGYPSQEFINLILTTPNIEQVTLVPDPPDVLTSNAGWDTVSNASFLQGVVELLHAKNPSLSYAQKGTRVSLFVAPEERMIAGAASVGADRVELYTEAYAREYHEDRKEAVAPYIYAAAFAKRLGLGLNAGHDLNQENLGYLLSSLKFVDEVSIGHALISEALYLGLAETVRRYRTIITESGAQHGV